MIYVYPKKLFRILSAAEYLQFIKSSSNREAISKVRIIPPKLGVYNDWGKIYIELDYEPERTPTRKLQ